MVNFDSECKQKLKKMAKLGMESFSKSELIKNNEFY